MTESGSRLSRWSRMKADARRTRSMRFAVPDEAADTITDTSLATGPDTLPNEEGAPSHPDQSEKVAAKDQTAPQAVSPEEEALPDIEQLDAQSDYTPFMSDKVSDAIRNQALRKLWRSDPVLACLDGLNDYDEDYTDAAMVIANMKTDYVVGRGMVDYEAEEAKKRAEEEAEQEAIAANDEPAEGEEESEAVVASDDDGSDENQAVIVCDETNNISLDDGCLSEVEQGKAAVS